ncbi:DUF2894 domain-containing protein [Thauera sp. SDU_THAU2]|uniref:DUF2894 domain-containing protein n=1 Tax=Thauera sp. SDU_THAU2 TaxID=3136633 RepID=UPI00311DB47C
MAEPPSSGTALPGAGDDGWAAEGEPSSLFRVESRLDAAPEDDTAALIDALRSRGAASFDPVGFRVIEAMWRRGENLQGAARAAVARKLARRLAALRERFEHAGAEVGASTENKAVAPGRPEPQQSVPGRHAPRRYAPRPGPLAELLVHAARQNTAAPLAAAAPGASGGELKSLHYFGSIWSRLSLEQQLSQALAQAPENAGPLNSHFLVLQALIRMRDIAPQYLENFMSYADALLWLDLLDTGKGAGQKTGSQKAATRKPATRKVGQKKTRGYVSLPDK